MKNTLKNTAIIIVLGLTVNSCEFLDNLFGKKDKRTEQVEEIVDEGYFTEYTYTITGGHSCPQADDWQYLAPTYVWTKTEIFVQSGEVKSEVSKDWRQMRYDYYGIPTYDTNDFYTQLDIVALFSDSYEYVEGQFHYLSLIHI